MSLLQLTGPPVPVWASNVIAPPLAISLRSAALVSAFTAPPPILEQRLSSVSVAAPERASPLAVQSGLIAQVPVERSSVAIAINTPDRVPPAREATGQPAAVYPLQPPAVVVVNPIAAVGDCSASALRALQIVAQSVSSERAVSIVAGNHVDRASPAVNRVYFLAGVSPQIEIERSSPLSDTSSALTYLRKGSPFETFTPFVAVIEDRTNPVAEVEFERRRLGVDVALALALPPYIQAVAYIPLEVALPVVGAQHPALFQTPRVDAHRVAAIASTQQQQSVPVQPPPPVLLDFSTGSQGAVIVDGAFSTSSLFPTPSTPPAPPAPSLVQNNASGGDPWADRQSTVEDEEEFLEEVAQIVRGGEPARRSKFSSPATERFTVTVRATSLGVAVSATMLVVDVVERGNLIYFLATFTGDPGAVHFAHTRSGESRPRVDAGFGRPGSQITRLDSGVYLFALDTTGFRGGTVHWHFWGEGAHQASEFGEFEVTERPPQLL